MTGAPSAAVYFARGSADMAKDLAARVRNDGVRTLMIWGDKFQDEQDIEAGVRAVIIQRSLRNATTIATTYGRFAAGVEIHFVSDDGEFENEAPAPHQPGRQADDPEPSQASDPGPEDPAEGVADTPGPEPTG